MVKKSVKVKIETSGIKKWLTTKSAFIFQMTPKALKPNNYIKHKSTRGDYHTE